MDRSSSLFSRMKDIIYTQKKAWECWSYACLNALQRMWVDISEEKIISFWSMLWYPDMEKTLISKWIIKGLSMIVSPRRIDNYLKAWEKLVVLIYHMNFESIRNTPYIQDFKGKMNHFVCIVEDLGDRYKVIDQQGYKYDSGYWYIKKEDMKGNTRVARLII